VVDDRSAEVADDVVEAASTDQEVAHRAGVVPQVEGGVLVDRGTGDAVFADRVGL